MGQKRIRVYKCTCTVRVFTDKKKTNVISISAAFKKLRVIKLQKTRNIKKRKPYELCRLTKKHSFQRFLKEQDIVFEHINWRPALIPIRSLTFILSAIKARVFHTINCLNRNQAFFL